MLHRYSVLVAVGAFLLVIAGALVTSSGAELPYQYAHRVFGGVVGALTIVLMVWLWRREKRPWLRSLGLVALLLVVFQGALGALTVVWGLPRSVGILHACIAQLFFAITAALAAFTTPGWQTGVPALMDSGRPSLRSLAVLLPFGILAQAGLGAAYRHGALGLAPHVVGAVVVTGVAIMISMMVLTQFPMEAQVAKPAKRLLVIVLHQVVLGVLAYFARIIPVEGGWQGMLVVAATVAHIGVGALTLAVSLLLAVEAWRCVKPMEPVLRY